MFRFEESRLKTCLKALQTIGVGSAKTQSRLMIAGGDTPGVPLASLPRTPGVRLPKDIRDVPARNTLSRCPNAEILRPDISDEPP